MSLLIILYVLSSIAVVPVWAWIIAWIYFAIKLVGLLATITES